MNRFLPHRTDSERGKKDKRAQIHTCISRETADPASLHRLFIELECIMHRTGGILDMNLIDSDRDLNL